MAGKVIILALTALPLMAEKNPFNGFIQNKGQWDQSVKYRKKVPHGFLLLQSNGWTYYLSHSFDGAAHANNNETPNGFQESSEASTSQAINTRFVGANPHPIISQVDAQSYYHNFFIGDKEIWADHVAEFNEVQYCEMYNKIDLKLFSHGSSFKYDLIVSPGGDPQQIAMDWTGAGEVYLSDGQLIVETEFGQLIEQRPFAYQLVDGDTVEVPAKFLVKNGQVSFDFPDGYDAENSLIIDPLLIFSTYSGSSADNWGNTATFDEAGNTYAGGIIFGASAGQFVPAPGVFQEDFNGAFDVVLMKFDSTGQQLLFATYLGGNHAETPISLIVNKNNQLVMMGVTSSANFPVTAGSFQTSFGKGNLFDPFVGNFSQPTVTQYINGSDIFVSILDHTGSQLIASTFLGGSENDGTIPIGGPLTLNYGDQFRGEVNLDENDNIYIASSSPSADFPMTNQVYGHTGNEDGLLVKMQSDLSAMIWGTFVGGDTTDVLFSVKPDGKGGVYAAGGTMSQAFPFAVNGWKRTNSGDAEGILIHFDETGRVIDEATFLGTDKADQAYFVDLDTDGNVYVMGQTKGNYFTKGDVYRNPGSGQFLQKFNSDLSDTPWSTVFGSGTIPPNISPTAFLVSDCNNIYISGWGGGTNINQSAAYFQGNTRDMPTTSDAFQSETDGNDFYLMVLDPDASSLRYATYFGGIPSSDHVDGGTSRFDKRGVVHHAVCAGCGQNQSNYLTTEEAWSTVNNSPNCNLGVFKFDLSTLSAAFATNTPDLLSPDIRIGCAPFTFLFENESVGGETQFWDFGDGAFSYNIDTVTHTYQSAGEYTVSLRINNPSTCKTEDIVYKKLVLTEGTHTLSPSTTICYGESVELEATGGTDYYWIPNNGSLSSNIVATPTADPRTSTTYFVTIYNSNNYCTFNDSVTVNVLEEIRISSSIEPVYDCAGVSDYDFTSQVSGAELAYWDFGDGTQSSELSGKHIYTSEGNFTARLVAPNELCVEEVTEVVKVGSLEVPNAFSPNGDGVNDRFEIRFIQPLPLTVVDRNGKAVYQNNEYTDQWDGGNLPAGVYYYDLVLPDFTTCNGWVHLMR